MAIILSLLGLSASGQLSIGFRNRVDSERGLSIGSYHPAPYLSAEVLVPVILAWNTRGSVEP